MRAKGYCARTHAEVSAVTLRTMGGAPAPQHLQTHPDSRSSSEGRSAEPGPQEPGRAAGECPVGRGLAWAARCTTLPPGLKKGVTGSDLSTRKVPGRRAGGKLARRRGSVRSGKGGRREGLGEGWTSK